MSAHVADGPKPGHATVSRRLILHAACAVGLALVLAISGAFDTDGVGALRRMVLWLIISGLLVGQAAVIDSLLARVTPPGLWGRLLAGAGTIGLMIPLMAVELQALKLTRLPPPYWGYDPFLELALFISPIVAVIAGLVVILRGALARPSPAKEAVASAAAPQPASDWPAEPILWVRAHDHYLEFATASRTVFLRGRLGNAVARLEGAPGLQVHRSWWVAKAAVASVRREGRDLVLVLQDGSRAPVGRSRIADLRSLGWV